MTPRERELDRARSKRYFAKHRERLNLIRKERSRKWRAENPEASRLSNAKSLKKIMADPVKRERYLAAGKISRRKALCRNHGWDAELYDATFRLQNGVCAICKRPETRVGQTFLSIDHDHRCCPGPFSCGDCIRGLLCDRCNRGIGFFRETAATLRSAADYIERTAK